MFTGPATPYIQIEQQFIHQYKMFINVQYSYDGLGPDFEQSCPTAHNTFDVTHDVTPHTRDALTSRGLSGKAEDETKTTTARRWERAARRTIRPLIYRRPRMLIVGIHSYS